MRELGSDWEKYFKHFNHVPIAAASIGQVHVAILQSGERVAVKIQYPGVSKSIDSDLDNLMMLLNLLMGKHNILVCQMKLGVL